MYKKLLTTIFNFSIIIAIVSILITTFILYYFFSGELKNELKDQMGALKPGVESEGEAYLKEVNIPERITLINPKGEVIYDNFRSTPLENHLDREEIKGALENGEGSSVRYSQTLNEKTYYYAIKLNNGNILRIAMDQASLIRILFGFLQIYLFIIIGAIIISFIISRKLVSSIMHSIETLDPDKPMASSTYPELTPLLYKIDNQNKEIKQQLKIARRQQADFQAVTANMNEGIIVIDQDHMVKSINDSAQNFLEFSKLVVGKSVFSRIFDEKLNKLIDEAFDGQKGNLVIDQDQQVLNIIASPIIVNEKQTGIVLIIIDITERVQMERLRSEYISNVSHELKTPLTSISGFAEIINNNLVKQEDIHYFSGKIYDEAQHLIQMVNNILTIGYLDESNEKILKVKLNLELISEEVIERLSNLAQKSNINIKLISKGNTELIGNPDILTELLFNLIENAIKYNCIGGKVVVYLNGLKSEKLIVKVIDSGEGISNNEIHRIFERFYRPDNSRADKKYGSGLGLSIVKHAAQVHNAEIKVNSIQEKGSVFTIAFKRHLK